MTITVIRPTRISGAGPTPRYTCLGQQDPSCPATRHGTYSAYNFGCRCPHAREAKRVYHKRLREQRHTSHYTDGTGTRRRLQALIAIGWRWQDLAEHLGGTWQNAQTLGMTGTGRVMVTTAARVRALYNRLSTTPGPSQISRLRAAAKGWPPPIAWDDDAIDDPTAKPNLGDQDTDGVDEVAVRRALEGERIQLNEAEREHAFRVGLRRGMTPTAIGQALHLSGSRARAIAAELANKAA